MRRRPTLLEVAAKAGVHFATASRALDPTKSHMIRDTTQEKVERAAKALGYSTNLTARGLRTGRSNVIGFCVADLANPFLAPIVRGAEDVLAEENYLSVVFATHENPKYFRDTINRLLDRGLDGLIISSARTGDLEFIRSVAKRVPVVLAIRDLGSKEFFSVTHDDAHGGRIATRHLLELGHNSIAEIRGPSDVSSFRGRSRGFKREVNNSGAEDVSAPRKSYAPTQEGGFEAAEDLIKLARKPTAIFAHNDVMAVGALKAFEAAGLLCPKDLSVVGYNDSPLTDRLNPPLTTIRLPGGEVGERAALRLLEVLKDPSTPPEVEKIQPELIVRSSTRKI